MEIQKFDMFESYDNKATYTQEEVFAIAADIRNKLGPMKNLITMIRKQREVSDPVIKEKLQEYINKEIHNSDVAIEYLTNFITKK
jgi:hypothetical protein